MVQLKSFSLLIFMGQFCSFESYFGNLTLAPEALFLPIVLNINF